MERAIQFPAKVLSRDAPSEYELGLFSTESVLNLQKLIFAGLSSVRGSSEHCSVG